jgi:hypothetical protein
MTTPQPGPGHEEPLHETVDVAAPREPEDDDADGAQAG